MEKENRLYFLNKLKSIAALFGVEFSEKESDLVEDISSIKENKDEIVISLTKRSYLRELISSWKFTPSINGVCTTEQEITIMLSK